MSSTNGKTPTPPAASINIRNAMDLRVFKQMLDKHEKGAEATKNTIEAFGGDAHAMDHVIVCIADWRRQAALQLEVLAPNGDDAAKGTPIGDALASAKGAEQRLLADDELSRAVGGPKIGDRIHWPAEGVTTSITKLVAIAKRDGAVAGFDVEDSEGWRGGIVVHYDSEAKEKQWRVEGANYATPTQSDPVAAAWLSAEQETTGTKIDGKKRGKGGTKKGTPVASTDAEVAPAVQRAADIAQDEALKAGASPAEAAAAAADAAEIAEEARTIANMPQRERNARAAGVTRPAPKSAGGKRGARR